MAINIRGRHFLTLMDFTPLEIRYLLDLSRDLKKKKLSGIQGDLLRGKSIVLLFEKGRIAFDSDLIKNTEQGLETRADFGTSLGKSV